MTMFYSRVRVRTVATPFFCTCVSLVYNSSILTNNWAEQSVCLQICMCMLQLGKGKCVGTAFYHVRVILFNHKQIRSDFCRKSILLWKWLSMKSFHFSGKYSPLCSIENDAKSEISWAEAMNGNTEHNFPKSDLLSIRKIFGCQAYFV